jgi:para-aminobenzoate synthetase component 1
MPAQPTLQAVLSSCRDFVNLACLDMGSNRTLLTWGKHKPESLSGPWTEAVRKGLEDSDGGHLPGGVVGWIGYEAGAAVEIMPAPKGVRALPDACLWRVDGAMWWDQNRTSWSIEGDHNFQEQARALLKRASDRGTRTVDADKKNGTWQPKRSAPIAQRYTQGVEAILKAIRAGQVYQVNLAWEHKEVPIQDGLDAYLRLRQHNPALRGAYLRYGPYEVLSNSPELFLEIDGRTRAIRSQPIKGTAATNGGKAAHKRLSDSEKERSELTMIVDLVRNDLGRVSIPGSVNAGPRTLRRCGDLWHAEQTVNAVLRDDLNAIDAVAAAFPPGSVTGAPKIQAMKMIHDLEAGPRGVYTGAIGWFSDTGDAHLNVAIRTVSVVDGVGRFHVGAGIVLDSQPEQEWQETIDKAQALASCLKIP